MSLLLITFLHCSTSIAVNKLHYMQCPLSVAKESTAQEREKQLWLAVHPASQHTKSTESWREKETQNKSWTFLLHWTHANRRVHMKQTEKHHHRHQFSLSSAHSLHSLLRAKARTDYDSARLTVYDAALEGYFNFFGSCRSLQQNDVIFIKRQCVGGWSFFFQLLDDN